MNYKLALAILVSGIAGIICGLLSTYIPSWLNILLSVIVAIVAGLLIVDKKTAKWSGIIFGACLTITLISSIFEGSSDKLSGFILLSVFLSLFGALYGAILVSIGSWIRREHFV